MKRLQALVWCLLACLAACSRPAKLIEAPQLRREPWPSEFVAAMAALPLQHDGRIKPFATLAAFQLYSVHGQRDLKFRYPDGGEEPAAVTLEPTEWLLDVWLVPQQAATYPLFRIEHTGVLDALGIENDGQSFSFEFLSYRELLQHAEKLAELAQEYSKLEQRLRSPVQEHLVQLWSKLRSYHGLHSQFEGWREPIALQGEGLRQALGGEQVDLGAILANAEALRAFLRSIGETFEDPKHGNLIELLSFLNQVTEADRGPRLLPPPQAANGNEENLWLAPGEALGMAMGGAGKSEQVQMALALQAALAASSPTEQQRQLLEFQSKVVAAATARGESAVVGVESYYYRAAWHYQAIHWFLFAFLLACGCWLLPNNRWLWRAALLVSSVALLMLVADISLRCWIRGRPPVTNLYDTFLFIAAIGVSVGLVTEWILPRRLALAAAPFLGALLIMCARLFEVSDGQDTLKPLVAVLDSNFWLATHVTTINIAYAAGVLAALLADVWVLLTLFRVSASSSNLGKSLVRMIYGVTAFSLSFGVVGTILGGVWANDSWGRFWGWDPKENGALMICLAQIALLHARFCGMVRDLGMVVWAAITGSVVMFSWFHVNLLQVGLHSYGFSAGLHDAVWQVYSVQLAVVLLACLARWRRGKAA